MNDVIDMTMADPFCSNAKDGGPSLAFSNPSTASGAPGLVQRPLGSTSHNVMHNGLSTPAFSSAMEAFAATKQLHARSLSAHKLHHQPSQTSLHSMLAATAATAATPSDYDDFDDDDDESMSTTSSQSMYDEDNSRSSSWSESESSQEDDDGNQDYTLYAPVAGASRGHLLRPMSLNQITALAVATGARKPCALQHLASLSSGNLQQGVVTFGAGGAVVHSTHRSASMPTLAPQITHYQQMTTAGTTTPVVDPSTGKTVPNPATAAAMRPDDRLLELLQAQGKSMDYCSYSEIPDFFIQVQPQHIEAFQQEIINAVRGKSVDTLRAMHQQGKMLQCCNKFGESIVHMACRQSSAQVLEFLLREAGVTFRVCCDSGRTPLHDACWTTSPDFDIIALLLTECPDFLRVKDKRGFSPLAYVPHAQWNRWGHFLEQNKHLLEFKGFA